MPSFVQLKVLDLVPFGQTGQQRRFFALRLSHPGAQGGWQDWQPGQFVMLRPENFGRELVWARPFGVCHLTSRHMVCFIQVVGRGTARLSQLRPGDQVDVWGPLGNGFAQEADTPTLLLAGGMGIVPFVGYAHKHPQPWNLTMLFGHREKLDCYPVDSINERIAVDTFLENGPADLEEYLAQIRERMAETSDQNGLVLACGPLPFLRAVQAMSAETGARCQLSLENRMGCGVGACLGCVTKHPGLDLPVQVCTRGPVFWADQVEL